MALQMVKKKSGSEAKPGTSRGQYLKPEPESVFIDRQAKIWERQMAEFFALLTTVRAQATQAVLDYGKDRRVNQAEAAAIFNFTKECGLRKAVSVLPVFGGGAGLRSDFDALPKFEPDEPSERVDCDMPVATAIFNYVQGISFQWMTPPPRRVDLQVETLPVGSFRMSIGESWIAFASLDSGMAFKLAEIEDGMSQLD
jgi:hypothetical protein